MGLTGSLGTLLENASEIDLNTDEDGTHWLNDRVFKMKYRCSRDAPHKINETIKDHAIFRGNTNATHLCFKSGNITSTILVC